jgi:hypothetical protein
MSLKKPLGLGLIIGLLAMAFAALPALASAASPELTDPFGPVAVGETISATSEKAVTEVEGTKLVCKHVEVHGIVTANGDGVVTVAMGGTGDSATDCTFGEEGTKVRPTLTSISLTAAKKTASFDFEVLTEAGFVTETSTSTVSYAAPASVVHVAGPVEGPLPGTFSGDFSISDAFGAVTVD